MARDTRLKEEQRADQCGQKVENTHVEGGCHQQEDHSLGSSQMKTIKPWKGTAFVRRELLKVQINVSHRERLNARKVCIVENSFPPFYWNSLGWPWLTKLYRFRVHNSTTQPLYSVLCVHHPKSSLHLSPSVSPHPAVTILWFISMSFSSFFSFLLNLFTPLQSLCLKNMNICCIY